MEVRADWVESEGHRLAYLAVNEHLASDQEPAVVFIHGVLASVNFWLDCVPPEFKEDRAWYSLSLPAHHPSTVPSGFNDIDASGFFRIMNGALQGMFGERKVIVVGHSTGGFCALNLAIHQAPNLAGIVSVAGFHKGIWGGVEGLLLKLAGLGHWAKIPFVVNMFISKMSASVRSIFAEYLAYDPKAFRSNPSSQRMLKNIEPDTLAQDPWALFTLFNGIAGLDIGHQLSRIQLPCYIFSGTDDPVVPTEQSQMLQKKIPGAKSVVFQKVGHMPFIEASEAYFVALGHVLKDIMEIHGTSINEHTGNEG